MCGNGIRCVAKYVYDYGLTDKTHISVETLGGIKYLDLTVEDGKVKLVKVVYGKTGTGAGESAGEGGRRPGGGCAILVDGEEYYMTCAVHGKSACGRICGLRCKDFPLETVGPKFENHERFPNRVNTEFVRVLDRHTAEMRVWERGSGETLACGTGACAVAVACALNGLTEDEVTVKLLGGDLQIRWDREKDTVYMTGPAEVVFDGEWPE